MSNRGIREALTRSRVSEAALAERTRELEASQRITLAASERVSPDDLLNLVVDLIRDQFDLYHVQVYFIDEQEQAAVLRKSTGYAGRQLLQMGHMIPLEATSLVTHAIRSGEPVLVEDVSKSPDFMANPLLPETRSELAVPLTLGDRIVGVLDAQDRAPGRFGESTVGLFQSLADQVAILFENSELIERITEQTDQMTAFTEQLRSAADIARRLGTILEPQRLGREVVELLQGRFGLYHAHIYLLDQETGKLNLEVGTGEVGRVLRERGHSIDLNTQQSLVARAARSQRSVLVPDTTTESAFMPNPLLPDTRSEVAVPLVVGDRVLGVLDLQHDQPGRFSEADRDTFGTLAGQIAVALQNAALFEQIQEAAQPPAEA
jgi:GAF domain-containing protein